MNSTSEPSDSVRLRPVYRSVSEYFGKVAVIDENGRYTYKNIFAASISLANKLLKSSTSGTLSGERIAFLCNPDVTYIITQWSCWLNDSICVPLCQDHPANVLEYYVEDSKASILVSTKNFETIVRPIAEKFNLSYVLVVPEDLQMGMLENETLENVGDIFSNTNNDALIIYTSGTTGPPKVRNKIMIDVYHTF